MKLALAAAVIALTGAAPHATVLGWDYGSKRISWFESDSLTSANGGATGWNRPLCSWSFSPDRHRVALSDCHGTVRFVAVPSLKSLGRIGASSGVWDAASLAWVTPTRVLAVNRANGSIATLLVVDTTTKRVVRRVDLGGVLLARAIVQDRVVLLLAPFDSFGPARVAVADASGTLASATIEGITAGTHFGNEPDSGPVGEVRTPGFAVDPGGTAYVVGADLRVAAVDLSTMRVSYHGPTRAPAKALNGSTRIAAWLGRGKIAVSGVDYASSGTGSDLKVSTTPFGLQLLDTATWTYRTLDTAAAGLLADGGRVFGTAPSRSSAFNAAGTHLYDIPAPSGTWVTPALGYAYVCSERWLTGVLDASTGAPVAIPKAHTRGCPTLLAGRAAPF
jgi:WD40 repeat protein